MLPPWGEGVGLPAPAVATGIASAQLGRRGSLVTSARQQQPERHPNDVAAAAAYRLNLSDALRPAGELGTPLRAH